MPDFIGNFLQLGPKPHHKLHAFSTEHGPLFRIRVGSVDVVVASSAAIASQFLLDKDTNFSNRHPKSGLERFGYRFQDLFFASYKPRWRDRRELLNRHLFSSTALQDLRRVREGEVARLVGKLWSVRRNEPVLDPGRAANECATNALALATVGQRVFQEEEEEMMAELKGLGRDFDEEDIVAQIGWVDLQGVVRRMSRLHRTYQPTGQVHRRAPPGTERGDRGGRDLLSVLRRHRNKKDTQALLVVSFEQKHIC